MFQRRALLQAKKTAIETVTKTAMKTELANIKENFPVACHLLSSSPSLQSQQVFPELTNSIELFLANNAAALPLNPNNDPALTELISERALLKDKMRQLEEKSLNHLVQMQIRENNKNDRYRPILNTYEEWAAKLTEEIKNLLTLKPPGAEKDCAAKELTLRQIISYIAQCKGAQEISDLYQQTQQLIQRDQNHQRTMSLYAAAINDRTKQIHAKLQQNVYFQITLRPFIERWVKRAEQLETLIASPVKGPALTQQNQLNPST